MQEQQIYTELEAFKRVFAGPIVSKIDTVVTHEILAFTPTHFEISALLPAVLYNFRFGQSRGGGMFKKVFAGNTYSGTKNIVTIDDVAGNLSNNPELIGFDDSTKIL